MQLSEETNFNISIKTLISIVGGVFVIISAYFGLMSKIDSRFEEIERKVEKALELPAPGTGNYSVDMGDPAASQTWPPSRPEFKMKDELSRTQINDILRRLEKLER